MWNRNPSLRRKSVYIVGFRINQFKEKEKKLLLQGEFGLEMESLRVTKDGFMAHTPHPFLNDPCRDRDFCENQVEMITGVSNSIDEMMEELKKLRDDTVAKLKSMPSGEEYLWPSSNPPYVKGEEDIEIAHYTGKLVHKEIYRNYLADKYGKKKMLYSGIHFNFSFPEELLRIDYRYQNEKRSNGESRIPDSYQDYKNSFYLDLSMKLLRYSWLIVYLTAASPLLDGSYDSTADLGTTKVSEYASCRCGDEGYWNDFIPVLDYSTLDCYTESINAYVRNGKLRQSSELYYPVRLKPKGVNSLEALSRGVNHIELRMFDLNPLSEVCIEKRDLEFVFLLLIYLSLLPKDEMSEEDQIRAITNLKHAARLDADTIRIDGTEHIRDAGLSVLGDMERMLRSVPLPGEMEGILSYQKNKLTTDDRRYARQIEAMFGEDYVPEMLAKIQGIR